jgi:hypothetical protein
MLTSKWAVADSKRLLERLAEIRDHRLPPAAGSDRRKGYSLR